MIPLASLTELQGKEGDQDVTLTFKVGTDATDSNVIQLADAAARDELLDALQDRLGPGWERTRGPVGRLSAGMLPFIATVIAGGLSWLMYNEAQLIAAGEHLKAVGKTAKTRAFSGAMHWVEGQIGETGVLIVGGVVFLLCAAALLNAVLRPAILITVRPKANP
jgi:hypothetical protein